MPSAATSPQILAAAGCDRSTSTVSASPPPPTTRGTVLARIKARRPAPRAPSAALTRAVRGACTETRATAEGRHRSGLELGAAAPGQMAVRGRHDRAGARVERTPVDGRDRARARKDRQGAGGDRGGTHAETLVPSDRQGEPLATSSRAYEGGHRWRDGSGRISTR